MLLTHYVDGLFIIDGVVSGSVTDILHGIYSQHFVFVVDFSSEPEAKCKEQILM